MNIRKSADYGMMYRKLTAILAQNLPQMIEVYAIGKAINQRLEKGAAVAAAEFLQANLPDRTGFSPRNVRRMRDFYRTYENDQMFLQLAMKLGWTLNVVIMEAELARDMRKWYLEQAREQKWSKVGGTDVRDFISGEDHDLRDARRQRENAEHQARRKYCHVFIAQTISQEKTA